MTRGRTARLWAAGILAGATALGSILGLVALNAGGAAQIGAVPLLRLAAGADRRADELISGPGVPQPDIRRKAAALSREAIAEFPYDVSALLRLAYLDAVDHGHLTDQGLGYLRRSYDLVPAEPELGLWRIQFALQDYSHLPPDLREAVKREVSIQWRSLRRRRSIGDIPHEIRDPIGRIMLTLWIYRLGRNETI